MRAMIGGRISAMIFISVPLLASWALSPVWSASQDRELLSLAVLADDVASDSTVSNPAAAASEEPISDLSDWTYTANPMSPTGKTTFSRRLLSTTQPGDHATPAGPNPRVPWLTQPESLGNQGPSTFALMVPANPPPQTSTGTVTSGNLQSFATPNTKSAPVTVGATQNLASSQNFSLLQNVAASQNARSFAFQPVTSSSPGSAGRKLDRSGNTSSN
jgi:hypothetical protein